MSNSVVPPRETLWVRLGPALTARNVWLLVAVFMVAVTMLSTLPGDVRAPALNLAGGTIASAAMLLVVWLSWLTILRSMSGPPRVLFALAATMLAGLVRGATYQWLLVAWEMSEPGPQGYLYRLFGGVVLTTTAVLTGALVKVNVEAHRVRLEQLEVLQGHLSKVLASSEAHLQSEQDTALRRIVADLTHRLDDLRASNPPLAAESLQQLTSDIVRPLSHQLAANAPEWRPPEPSTITRTLDWAKVWAAMASPASINPLGPAIVMLVAIPSSTLHMGIWAGILMHLVGAVLICIGLALLRRTAGQVADQQPTYIRLLVTFALMVVACAPAAVAVWFLADDESSLVNATYVLLVMPIVALMFSFIRAAGRQQQRIDEQLSALAEQTQWWIVRTGMVQWWQNAALARALHGPVQSAIHVAEGRLRAIAGARVSDPSLTRAVLDDVSVTLSQTVMNGQSPAQLGDELAQLQTSWHPLLELVIDCPGGVAAAVDADSVCAEISLGIVSEAVSNAVRHGGARQVRIAADISGPETLTLEISDDGTGWAQHDRKGLGTAQLTACALDWTYSSADGINRLVVSLPWLRSDDDSSPLAVAARGTLATR